MTQRILGRRRGHVPHARKRAVGPTLESLEGRQLLYATTGGAFVNPALITYSFLPDGTDVGGMPSTLAQSLNSYYPTATWQAQFQKAAAVWEAVANINLAQVSDDGSPLGNLGEQQADARFGDIRIGGVPVAFGELGLSFLPPPYNGGTLAGDILMNTTKNWGPTGFDLETVAIHEFGHALGMSHSQTTNAVMYGYYTATKQALNGDDVNGIRSIYGALPSDPLHNDNADHSLSLTPQISNNQVTVAGMTLVGSSDQDWYSVSVPATTTGSMTVSMQSSNLSSLSPKLAVYDSAVHGLAQVSASYSYGATVVITINNVTPGQLYYVRASAALGSLVGAFGLQINFGANQLAPVAPPFTHANRQVDNGGGSIFLDVVNDVIVKTDGTKVPKDSGDKDNSDLNDDDGHGHGKVKVGSLNDWGDALSVNQFERTVPLPRRTQPEGPVHGQAPAAIGIAPPKTVAVVVNLHGAKSKSNASHHVHDAALAHVSRNQSSAEGNHRLRLRHSS